MAQKTVFLLFPHQLFQNLDVLKNVDEVYLIEEYLFFRQYKFHKQKLALHRASMKYYEHYLKAHNLTVRYVEAPNRLSDVRLLIAQLAATDIEIFDVCDNWLGKRIASSCKKKKIRLTEHPTPLFINSKEELQAYFGVRERYFQTDFYIQQRKKRNILLDEQGKPQGGKWSFDSENRLKYPKNQVPPKVNYPKPNAFVLEARTYVTHHFAGNYGTIPDEIVYPTTHEESTEWLQQFLTTRLSGFGPYEDAIVQNEGVLHHSVLTPILNIGLLAPMQIVNAALDYASAHDVPLNSLEGFVRQIIGWREFIRGVYLYKGTLERNANFWNFQKPMPSSFYTATTGIDPIDATIQKLLSTGYNHHIERLMLLGNFMLLSRIAPNAVYQWFMEMYIDAYDWVMVPNVYGMSQFSDGGIMATKPYVSGSAYVLKMSNYPKGSWCTIWDALFWQFMNDQRTFFLSNPRLSMLIATYDKMGVEKKEKISEIAGRYFSEK